MTKLFALLHGVGATPLAAPRRKQHIPSFIRVTALALRHGNVHKLHVLFHFTMFPRVPVVSFAQLPRFLRDSEAQGYPRSAPRAPVRFDSAVQSCQYFRVVLQVDSLDLLALPYVCDKCRPGRCEKSTPKPSEWLKPRRAEPLHQHKNSVRPECYPSPVEKVRLFEAAWRTRRNMAHAESRWSDEQMR